MLVERIENRPINSNCYIVYTLDNPSCIIVDPGTENCTFLIESLKQKKLIPQFVILTHSHFDHIWGVNDLRNEFQSIRVICNTVCNLNIKDSKKNLSLFHDTIGFCLHDADILIEDVGFRMKWNSEQILFMNTPGHSNCSISFELGKFLFSGDLFIKDIATVTKLPSGSKKKLIETTEFFKDKYSNKGMIMMPGHGDCYPFDGDCFKFHLND